MGAKQKAQLRRMVDFKFTRHPSLNLPEQRLTAIEKQLVERYLPHILAALRDPYPVSV